MVEGSSGRTAFLTRSPMQRFEGKNVEEALDHAAAAFGVERYKLRHAVLTEKRGFLGGVKRVVIVAEARPSAPPRRERAPRGGGRSGNRGGGSRDSRPARGGGGRRRRRELDD